MRSEVEPYRPSGSSRSPRSSKLYGSFSCAQAGWCHVTHTLEGHTAMEPLQACMASAGAPECA